jgi:hypothetical protein
MIRSGGRLGSSGGSAPRSCAGSSRSDRQWVKQIRFVAVLDIESCRDRESLFRQTRRAGDESRLRALTRVNR